MEEQDYMEIYETLIRVLQEEEFSKLVSNVQQEILPGKVVEVDIIEVEGKTRRRKALTHQEYTYKEQLEILIDALECSVIEKSQIVNHVQNFFIEERANYEESLGGEDDAHDRQLVLFYSDEAGTSEPSTIITVDPQRTPDSIVILQRLLDRVKSLIRDE